MISWVFLPKRFWRPCRVIGASARTFLSSTPGLVVSPSKNPPAVPNEQPHLTLRGGCDLVADRGEHLIEGVRAPLERMGDLVPFGD
jgi:hypothetical protein